MIDIMMADHDDCRDVCVLITVFADSGMLMVFRLLPKISNIGSGLLDLINHQSIDE